MRYTGERVIPWDEAVGARVLGAHVARYAFAAPLCWQRWTVDLGCGTGYGTLMLSWAAHQVIGVDVDEDALHFARTRFAVRNTRYEQINLAEAAPPRAEVYVAFEVLEHLSDPRGLLRRLPGGAMLIWSMPVNDGSRFHRAVYSEADIDVLMGAAGWQQSEDGLIAPRGAGFEARYLIGVRTV